VKNGEVAMQRSIVIGVLIVVSFCCVFAQNDVASLRWHQWDEGIVAAHTAGKFMLVDVYTDWCSWCKKLDKSVYVHPQVQELLAASFVPVKLNAESEDKVTNGSQQYTEQQWAKMLDVKSYPTILVFDSNFQLVARLRGYLDAESFIIFLHFVTEKYYTKYTFDEYYARVWKGK
jgi:thioredoxin-related protein